MEDFRDRLGRGWLLSLGGSWGSHIPLSPQTSPANAIQLYTRRSDCGRTSVAGAGAVADS